MKQNGFLLFMALWLLSACTGGAAATPAPPPSLTAAIPTAALPTITPEAATALPPTATTGEAAPTTAPTLPTPMQTAEATAATGASSDTLPASELFDVTWTERADFAAALISSEQAALTMMEDASVYHLDVTISEDYRRMMGKEELYYTNREAEPLAELVFRLYPNLLGGSSVVSNVRVNGVETTPLLELEDTILRVPLATPLQPNKSVLVAMSFDVKIPDSPEGNYGSFAYVDGALALAHAYPMIAEYTAEEGGWEAEIPSSNGDLIYAASSFYRVRLTAPAAAKIVASGTAIEETSNDTTQTNVYVAAPMRDFYIAMSENYVVTETQVGETRVRSYAYSDEAAGVDIMEESAASIEIFNDLIGNYPFTDFEIAQTPNLALGIEYPGVVVMTSRLYGDNGMTSGAALEEVREATVAHELGHQWFYSTVGNDQLDEPWLDESLAQYVTYRYLVTRYGETATEGFRLSLQGRWTGVGGELIPIGMPVDTYSPQEYGAIVYGRGPLFFIALAEEIGVDTMDTFLKNYYAKHKFGISTTALIKADIEETCGCDVTPLFEEWVYSE